MALLAASIQLAAHDDRIHKATLGEVVEASAGGLALKTRTGVVKVRYSSKTAFDVGGKPASKAAVKVGGRVGVIGSKLPAGELMAHEVLLLAPAQPGEKPAGHKH
jgi:hypothetical protein